MIHYRISPLDSNKTILEQLEDIKKYLTENPQYQVFYYNGNYINTTNTYEVTNLVLNASTINKGDIVLFANSYYAVVDAIGNNNFVVEHAIEMNSQAILDLRNFVISNYQTKLNFDTTPTLGSNNPVTSDGIKKAINETIQTEHQVPSGGNKSQVLGKISNTDYDYNWIDIYPVGSIYMSVNNISPASLFGGSWEALNNGNPCYILNGNMNVDAMENQHDIYGSSMLFKTREGSNIDKAFNNRVIIGSTGQLFYDDTSSESVSSATYISPSNLYARVDNTTTSAYMWKRIS